MSEIFSMLNTLRRPRLLIRAARHGMPDYNRERTLTRLIESRHNLAPEAIVEKLIQEESRVEDERRSGNGAYSVGQHIEILIALMSEARLLVRRASEVGTA